MKRIRKSPERSPSHRPDHGQCALRTPTGEIDLTATFHAMQQMAVQRAEVGADVVLPTSVLDGSVRTVRTRSTTPGRGT
ncbi:hypothetical protein [Streptomyces sp. NPDC001933]|uniref:hypothetical protein n=1 Tax=Streptomyces sp. NPDC001933 TaxID=3364626 RepID=UPI0036A696C8